jgi:hypothetical protein
MTGRRVPIRILIFMFNVVFTINPFQKLEKGIEERREESMKN